MKEVNSVAGTTTESLAEDRKGSASSGNSSRTQRRPRNGSDEGSGNGARFFLAKPGTNGSPVLEREVASENEALVESFRSGLSYYSVQEFRAVSDVSGRNPQLKREAVESNRK